MAEEAKDSPGKVRAPPCEFPEGALDLLKKLTEGKPPTRATGGWLSWEQIVNEMNEHFEPVNKMHHPKFTYSILQRKAVAEGWYKPAPPVHFSGGKKTGTKHSNMLARNPEWMIEMQNYFAALPKPMPRGSVKAAHKHMQEKFPDFVLSCGRFGVLTKEILDEKKSFFEIELDEEERADIESLIAEEEDIEHSLQPDEDDGLEQLAAIFAEQLILEAEQYKVDPESSIEFTMLEPNPKALGSKAFERYEQYKSATTRKEYKEKGGTTRDWNHDLNHGFIQFKSVKLNAREEDDEEDEPEVELTLEEKYDALLKENASQKKRIEKLIDTAIAFITLEDTKAYLEDEGDLAYNDDDIYDAIVKVCGEGFDKDAYYAGVHDLLRDDSEDEDESES